MAESSEDGGKLVPDLLESPDGPEERADVPDTPIARPEGWLKRSWVRLWGKWWGRILAIVVPIGAFALAVTTVAANVVTVGQATGVLTPPAPQSQQTAGPVSTSSPTIKTYSGGQGPARDTFTWERPAPYPALNSITDDPNIGDQRNFVRIRLQDAGLFRDEVTVKPGDILQVEVAVFNNAADNLGYSGMAHGLTAVLGLPPIGSSLPLGVTLSGTNVASVWDGATARSQSTVYLAFNPGSATFLTNNGTFPISDYFGSGSPTLLGQEALDGEFPIGFKDGIYQGSGYVQWTYTVVAAE